MRQRQRFHLSCRGLALLVLLVPLGLAVTSCGFAGSLPEGAILLCRDDDECPQGQRCETRVHECVSAEAELDVTGPVVQSAVFEPASARDGATVTLTLRANEPLGPEVPALVFAGGPAPDFVPLPVEEGSKEVRLTLLVDEDLGEGFYDLAEVTLSDLAANVRRSFVDGAVLHVDRTPPTVEGVRLAGGLGGVFSERAGSNAAQVRFFTSESVPADDVHVDVRLGSVRLSCAAGDAPSEIVCSATLDGLGVVPGDNPLAVAVRDEAGNEGTALSTARVDLEPPAVVAGSVEVLIDGSPNAPYAQPGSLIELAVLFDEPLAAPPVVTLDDGQALVFEVRQASGSFYRLALPLSEVAAAGSYGLTARVSDLFGHEGSAPVPLPVPFADGIALVDGAISPCTVPPDEAGNTCTDHDGDGVDGVSAGCAPPLAARDCDDADPLVFPGADEIPGDGRRNDCVEGAADAPLDGIFFDAVGGNDANPGTRAAPKKTLGRATVEQGATLLLARGTYSVDMSNSEDLVFRGVIIGGLDPVTWQRTTERSVVRRMFVGVPNPCFTVNVALQSTFVGLTFTQSLRFNQAVTLVDTQVEGCVTSEAVAPLFMVGGAFAAPLSLRAGGNRIIDADLARLEVGGDAFVAQSRLSSSLAVTGEVTVVNSAISGLGGELVTCTSCTAVRIATSNLLADATSPAVRATGDVPSFLSVVASNLRVGGNAPIFDLGPQARVTAADNLLAHPGASLLVRGALVVPHDDAGLATLNDCSFAGCVLPGGGNFDGVFDIAADRLHAQELGGVTSDVRGRARAERMPFAPTTMARDVDGQCRYADGAPDVGPDEL